MFPDRRPRSFLDSQVLSRLAAIPMQSRRPMLGNVSGRHASPHRGASVEFAEYRKYVPGDDLRRLDWRAYGRSDRFYVKEFEADTNLRLCVVLDTSGSMDFGSTGITKIEYARKLAGSLGYLALQWGIPREGWLAIASLTRADSAFDTWGEFAQEAERQGAWIPARDALAAMYRERPV